MKHLFALTTAIGLSLAPLSAAFADQSRFDSIANLPFEKIGPLRKRLRR